MRKKLVRRPLAVFAAVVTTAAVTLVAAPAAHAAPLTATVAAKSKPTIYTNTPNQPAGDLTITVNGAVAVGDTVMLQVDDNDSAANCAATGDTIGFSATPSVSTSSTVNPAPAFNAAVSSSAGACATASVNDVLTLTATASATGGAATITVTGIQYSVGAAAATGDIQFAVNGGSFSTTAADAAISAVKVNAPTPVFIPSDASTSMAINNIVLTETSAGGVQPGQVCIAISGAGMFDPSAGPPTVTATGGGAVGPIIPPPTPPFATFTVTTASTAPGTYTISGLKVQKSGTGFVQIAVGENTPTCDTFGSGIVVAFVGTVDRIAGGTRYGTAQKIADTFGCLASNPVVMARGDTFPDALAASYLAGQLKGPILLTDPATLPSETANVLRQHGVANVILIGGTTAISTDVENALKNTAATDCSGNPVSPAANISVQRVQGPDRYATAKAVAEFSGLGSAGAAEPGLDATDHASCGTGVKTAIVALGTNFPDALSAGPLAYAGMMGTCTPTGGPLPLLLTPGDSLSASASQALTDLSIKQVILMGGTTAVGTSVENAIKAANGGTTVVRIQGPTRQGTAAAMATSILENAQLGGFDGDTVFVSRPDAAPDALTAGPLAGTAHGALLLTDSTVSEGPTVHDTIAGWAGPTTPLLTATAVGGEAALAQSVLDGLAAALAGQTPA